MSATSSPRRFALLMRSVLRTFAPAVALVAVLAAGAAAQEYIVPNGPGPAIGLNLSGGVRAADSPAAFRDATKTWGMYRIAVMQAATGHPQDAKHTLWQIDQGPPCCPSEVTGVLVLLRRADLRSAADAPYSVWRGRGHTDVVGSAGRRDACATSSAARQPAASPRDRSCGAFEQRSCSCGCWPPLSRSCACRGAGRFAGGLPGRRPAPRRGGRFHRRARLGWHPADFAEVCRRLRDDRDAAGRGAVRNTGTRPSGDSGS